jgi:hypothetical protein
MPKPKVSGFPRHGKASFSKRQGMTDLKRRFLEIQLLRQKLRVAQCGRIAPAHEDQFPTPGFNIRL